MLLAVCVDFLFVVVVGCFVVGCFVVGCFVVVVVVGCFVVGCLLLAVLLLAVCVKHEYVTIVSVNSTYVCGNNTCVVSTTATHMFMLLLLQV